MSDYVGDQQTSTPMEVGGVAAEVQPSVLKTAITVLGEAPVYVFSAYYTVEWNAITLSFRPGMGYQLDAALLAYLTAAGAPMVAA